jgi:hypothetical protein
MKQLVRCPNLCFDGKIKTYYDSSALFNLNNCPYCKGKGKVNIIEANKINKLL